MSPKMPMSKFQQTVKKSGAPTPPVPVQDVDEMTDAMIDQQIADNAATEARIEADEQDHAEVTEAAALAETTAPVACAMRLATAKICAACGWFIAALPSITTL